ncbi:hypothetical protein OAM67_00545 [bacterium]|nr:hypothetical protein [bacterium]
MSTSGDEPEIEVVVDLDARSKKRSTSDIGDQGLPNKRRKNEITNMSGKVIGTVEVGLSLEQVCERLNLDRRSSFFCGGRKIDHTLGIEGEKITVVKHSMVPCTKPIDAIELAKEVAKKRTAFVHRYDGVDIINQLLVDYYADPHNRTAPHSKIPEETLITALRARAQKKGLPIANIKEIIKWSMDIFRHKLWKITWNYNSKNYEFTRKPL